VEFINGTFAVYNKTNGSLVTRIPDFIFWENAGVTIPDFYFTSDPRIIYDSATQRWFASQVDFDISASDPTDFANDFLIAVSDSADPAGTWHGVLFFADPTNGFFADFPTLGVDSNAVYISGDMFSSSTPLGSTLWSIPKADLLLNEIPAVITNATFFGTMNYSDRGQVLQPSSCFDGSGSGDVLAVINLFAGNSLQATKVLNGNSTNAALATATSISVDPYTVCIDPVQPDGTANLGDGDSRLSARVYTVGGVIYAVHNIEVGTNAAIRWYRINATDYTLLEAGTITNADLDLFFPSISATSNGVIVIACNGSGINTPVSSFAYAGQTVNGATEFGDPVLLQAGTIGNYHDGIAYESRWGDYSTTSADPSDPSRFWTIQLLPITSNNWVTRITEILVRPQLAITTSDSNVTVSWPVFGANYQLQSSANLVNGWSVVPQTPSTNGGTISVSLPAGASQQFFRLTE
jgi:hypothetical protein